MAEKGWTAQVAAAAGVAAGTGAAQLGLGYGLGVVEWPAVPAADSVWLGSLGWATWIAASSTVFGAVIAGRLGRAVGGPWRFALAVSAAVGALLTVALIALPARAAVRTETFSPQTIAGGYAVIGVLLGLFIAYWAVVSRPVAANLIATAVWLWSLAVAAVVTTIFWHRPSATYLSSWQFFSPDTADGQYGIIFWPSALLTLLAAFAVGIIGALPAIRRGDLGVGAASSGAVGPLLVAAAFFVLAPQLTGTPGQLQSAYLIAPYAVLAGLAGSAFAVALGQRQVLGRAGTEVSRPQVEQAKPGTGPRSQMEQAKPGTGPRSRVEQARPGTGPRPQVEQAEAGTGPRRPGEVSDQAADTGKGSAKPAVPSPRQAPATKSKARTDAEAGAAPDTAAPRPRGSFMDRFRRKGTGTDKSSSVATGRAKAPSAPAAAPSPSSEATATGAGRVSARAKSPDARSGAARPGATQSDAARPDAARPGAAQSDAARPGAAPPGAARPGAARPDAARSDAARSDAARSDAARSGAARSGAARSGAPSVDGGARPAESPAPGRSDSRSTVAPPPSSPPIAKINDPRSGEKPPAPQKSAARPSGNPAPGPANAVGSDKTPAARKTPAKTTKATSGRATPAKPSNPSRAGDADTAELPVQDARRPGARRPGEDEAR